MSVQPGKQNCLLSLDVGKATCAAQVQLDGHASVDDATRCLYCGEETFEKMTAKHGTAGGSHCSVVLFVSVLQVTLQHSILAHFKYMSLNSDGTKLFLHISSHLTWLALWGAKPCNHEGLCNEETDILGLPPHHLAGQH